jgi:endonuclease I
MALVENYSVQTSLSYNAARNYMFEDFDVVGGAVRGVYTGLTYQYTGSPNRIEAQDNGFNTEHSWPQSYFDSASPMRTDIHHLFITRGAVNSARSNYRFDEIDDEQTTRWYYLEQNLTSKPTENINEYSELLGGTSFEPREDHKGNVARAMFYFWTVYQNNVDIINDDFDNEVFFNSMKDVLLDWHLQDEVDEAEIQRSLNIESVQGNRNPFVHDTTLVRRAYFGAGPVGTSVEEEEIPKDFTLRQNYPNPFNPSTTIEFELSSASTVSLNIYNANGQLIEQLLNQRMVSGSHQVVFNASNLASGVYVYSLKVGDQILNKQMTLIK